MPADPLTRGHGRESSFREDFARDGDYLGRHPGDISGRGRFDEEYFVDEGLSLGPDLSSGDREEGRPSGELGRYRGFGPKNYVRSDERIREDVCDRLTDDPLIDASEIEVFVQSSEVTLAGRVETKAQRMASEQCAGAVSGVAQVRNHLRIGT